MSVFDFTTDCLQIIMEKTSIQRISKAADNNTTVDTAATTTTTSTIKSNASAIAIATVTISPYVSSVSQHSATKLSSEKKCTYRKLQKLRGRKVSRFIGFYHNVGKTFVVLLLISTKTSFWVYIGTQNGTYKISGENFCGLSKIHENREGFLLRRFYCLRYVATYISK